MAVSCYSKKRGLGGGGGGGGGQMSAYCNVCVLI